MNIRPIGVGLSCGRGLRKSAQEEQYHKFNNKFQTLPVEDRVAFTGIEKLGNKSIKSLENEIMISMTNCLYGCRPIGHHSPEAYARAAAHFDYDKFITLGGESAVFKLKNGQILKMSIYNYNPYIPKFHAPEHKRGIITFSENFKVIDLLHRDRKTNRIYYVIQSKGVTNVKQKDIDEFLALCEKDGHPLVDIKYDQFAYFNINNKPEVRFIDLGCIDTLGEWEKPYAKIN